MSDFELALISKIANTISPRVINKNTFLKVLSNVYLCYFKPENRVLNVMDTCNMEMFALTEN